ncbi:MAG: rubredoxin [Bacteroidota bacterium]
MELQRILVKGGVLSPSELKQIILFAESLGLKSLSFGSRQDICFPVVEGQANTVAQFPDIDLESISKRRHQNIVCSYVSSEILPTTSWVGSATYLYVLEQFRGKSTLEINVTDPKQRLVPLFTGHLNFIASQREDYWYLYLKLPHWDKHQRYPVLIYTWDIGKVAAMIEKHCVDFDQATDIFNQVNQLVDTSNNRTIDQPLEIPYVMFPYYEGMNRTAGSNSYWLGLYWRDNQYYLSFLKAVCELCLECKIGKICITPWKSFIVKGIQEHFKIKWEKLLGKFGINVRHSLLELNWHLPVANQSALDLKRFIVRNFDQNDISTYGLTFGISSPYSKNFTAIVLQENPKPQAVKDFDIRPTYNVLYAKNFDPNTLQYLTYAQDVDKIELPGLLMELSRLYFDQLEETPKVSQLSLPENTVSTSVIMTVHQCEDCLTIYDENIGMPELGIPPKTAFADLPEDFACPVCENEKESFQKVTLEQANDFVLKN